MRSKELLAINQLCQQTSLNLHSQFYPRTKNFRAGIVYPLVSSGLYSNFVPYVPQKPLKWAHFCWISQSIHQIFIADRVHSHSEQPNHGWWQISNISGWWRVTVFSFPFNPVNYHKKSQRTKWPIRGCLSTSLIGAIKPLPNTAVNPTALFACMIRRP